MSEALYEFEHRVQRLQRKRRKARARADQTFIDQDGYVIVQAKSRPRPVPLLGLALLALGVFALKGAMIAQLGPEAYQAQLTEVFSSSSVPNKIGAWLLQPDSVSTFFANAFSKLF